MIIRATSDTTEIGEINFQIRLPWVRMAGDRDESLKFLIERESLLTGKE